MAQFDGRTLNCAGNTLHREFEHKMDGWFGEEIEWNEQWKMEHPTKLTNYSHEDNITQLPTQMPE
jgi:hypothetical protein